MGDNVGGGLEWTNTSAFVNPSELNDAALYHIPHFVFVLASLPSPLAFQASARR